MLKIPRVHGYEAARRFTGQNIHLFICFIVRGVAFSVIFLAILWDSCVVSYVQWRWVDGSVRVILS